MINVSIVTISQASRIKFLRILAKCIKKQDYKNIIEWVIVDTSAVSYSHTKDPNINSSANLDDLIDEFKMDPLLPRIVYGKTVKKVIGGWRNDANKLVTGDIIVCMDDDDYYPPQRVSHCVETLADKKTLLAGCDKIFYYDCHFNKMLEVKGFENTFGPYHSTNNCMAYWREYLNNHSYTENPKRWHAEEDSFTNDWKEPLKQMDPFKTILQFSYDANTYNKKRLILNNYLLPDESKYNIEINMKVNDFIKDEEIYNDYKRILDLLTEPRESPYDIVYIAGGSSIKWSPLQEDLGGSEQAIKYLTMEWAKSGKKVGVYYSGDWEGTFHGVEYIDFAKYRFWDKHKTVIFWRLFGSYPYLELTQRADKIIIDFHDHSPDLYGYLMKYQDKISAWMFKSEFQKLLVEQTIGSEIKNSIIIPNGIRTDEFSKAIKESRNPFRMCYCSCYTRGLFRILKNIWPHIYKLEPRAELHVYYGMDNVRDQKFMDQMKILLAQPGVMDHGRQPISIISREKHMSTFHFYYTSDLAEIDCISIRESLVAGCIPILSDINLFKYRDGIHLKWMPDVPDFNYQIACGIVEFMHNDQLQNELRSALAQSQTIISWQDAANAWLRLID